MTRGLDTLPLAFVQVLLNQSLVRLCAVSVFHPYPDSFTSESLSKFAFFNTSLPFFPLLLLRYDPFPSIPLGHLVLDHGIFRVLYYLPCCICRFLCCSASHFVTQSDSLPRFAPPRGGLQHSFSLCFACHYPRPTPGLIRPLTRTN